jgi:hypothetical protein
MRLPNAWRFHGFALYAIGGWGLLFFVVWLIDGK